MDSNHLREAADRMPDIQNRVEEALAKLLSGREDPMRRPWLADRPPVVALSTWDPDRRRLAFDSAIHELETARSVVLKWKEPR